MSRTYRHRALARLIAAVALSLGSVAQAQQQPAAWNQLPRMKLERQFAGPLQDTIIQRWRDPADGTVCYIYLPITAPHSPPTASGYVQYGANGIGSISCVAGPPAVTAGPPAPRAPPRSQASPGAPTTPPSNSAR